MRSERLLLPTPEAQDEFIGTRAAFEQAHHALLSTVLVWDGQPTEENRVLIPGYAEAESEALAAFSNVAVVVARSFSRHPDKAMGLARLVRDASNVTVGAFERVLPGVALTNPYVMTDLSKRYQKLLDRGVELDTLAHKATRHYRKTMLIEINDVMDHIAKYGPMSVEPDELELLFNGGLMSEMPSIGSVLRIISPGVKAVSEKVIKSGRQSLMFGLGSAVLSARFIRSQF